MRLISKSLFIAAFTLVGASAHAQQINNVSKNDAFVIQGRRGSRIVKMVEVSPKIRDQFGRVYTLPLEDAIRLDEQPQTRFIIDTTDYRAIGSSTTIRAITMTYTDPNTDKVLAYDVDGQFIDANKIQNHNPQGGTERQFMSADQLAQKLQNSVFSWLKFTDGALKQIEADESFTKNAPEILKGLASQGTLSVVDFHEIQMAFISKMTDPEVIDMLKKTGTRFGYSRRIDAARAAIKASATQVVPEAEARQVEDSNR